MSLALVLTCIPQDCRPLRVSLLFLEVSTRDCHVEITTSSFSLCTHAQTCSWSPVPRGSSHMLRIVSFHCFTGAQAPGIPWLHPSFPFSLIPTYFLSSELLVASRCIMLI